MNRVHIRWGIALLVLILFQFACSSGREAMEILSRISPTPRSTPLITSTFPAKPTSPVKGGVNCNVPEAAYSWAYERPRKSTGTGGTLCDAYYVFKNNYSTPVHLIIKTAFDNNKLKGEKWEQYIVQPGKTWESHVSRTEYKTGVVTFESVEKFLVFREERSCDSLFREDKNPFWEADGIPVSDFACQ